MTSRTRIPSRLLVLAVLSMATAVPASAGGLRCSVGEVVIENLKIGRTYSLRSLANLPLSLTSTCEGPVVVRVDPLIPDASELRLGAEAILDRSWVSCEPETLVLAPGETRAAEMTLTIPDDERLFGRKFQATFWSHTLPREGELIAYGLKSRVIFTVDTLRADAEEEPSGDIGIEFTPTTFKLEDVRAGKTYAIGNDKTGPFQVRNVSDRPLTVEIATLSASNAGVPLERDCGELLGTATVTLTPNRFTLAPGESQTITGTMSLGRDKLLKGKNLMCVVSAAVADLPIKTRIYSRIYANAR